LSKAAWHERDLFRLRRRRAGHRQPVRVRHASGLSPVLAGAGPARWVTVLSDGPSAALTGFLDGHQMLMAMLAAGLLIAGVVIALLVRRCRAGREPAQPSPGGEGCCTPDQASPSAEDTGRDRHAVAVINGEARPS
jgi:hypothetical protein